ncbi:hypothetical protein CLF_109062 [Clonorchis sinensis]|uniref:Uncharacterized protein n=1 Tax=Clonorchis sinensis TaxID=79923 RepID=G7YIW4_CLOSI|nr:hypothetical protein CLF_109062 [Clonorchis sinensis]
MHKLILPVKKGVTIKGFQAFLLLVSALRAHLSVQQIRSLPSGFIPLQVVFNLFAELGTLIANVSSPVAMTTSLRC